MKKLWKGFLCCSLALGLCACVSLEEEEKREFNPPDIVEDGVLGSWTYSGADTPLPLIAMNWYIEESQTTIAHRCEFNGKRVVVDITVASSIDDSVLTFEESDDKSISEGDMICSVSVKSGTSYGLSLAEKNILDVSRNGKTRRFSRIATNLNLHVDDDQ